MTPELKFPSLSREEFLDKAVNHSAISTKHNGAIMLDNLFVPVIKHHTRYFLRAVFNSSNKLQILYVYCPDSSSIVGMSVYNNVFPEEYNPDKLMFEDNKYSLKGINQN